MDGARLPRNTMNMFVGEVNRIYHDWRAQLYRYETDRKRASMTAMFVELPISMGAHASALIGRLNFAMHHATQNRFLLVRSAGVSADNISPYGTHYMRVECIVRERGTGRVLLVHETFEAEPHEKHITGTVNAGEFFRTAAEREVAEETGVKATFHSVVGVSNRLRMRYGCDEIAACVLLVAEPNQEASTSQETSSARWVDVAEARSLLGKVGAKWLRRAECDDHGTSRFSEWSEPDYCDATRTMMVYCGAKPPSTGGAARAALLETGPANPPSTGGAP